MSSGNSPNDGRPNNVPQFKQMVYERWKSGRSPCLDCPNHHLKNSCHPQFGVGNFDPDLMFVGNAPGADDQYRYGDDTDRQIDSEKVAQAPDIDAPQEYSNIEYNLEHIQSGKSANTMQKHFFHDVNGIGGSFSDVYFTNIKKCSDVHGTNHEKARVQCQTYLPEEIALVDPKLIITWGLPAAKGAASALGMNINRLPNSKMDLMLGGTSVGDQPIGYWDTDPLLITMPHWSGIRGNNLQELPTPLSNSESPIKATYYALADLVDLLI